MAAHIPSPQQANLANCTILHPGFSRKIRTILPSLCGPNRTAEWEVHVERNASEGVCPCFNTFSKRYLSHWKHVLVMRKVSQHGQCKLCFDLHQVLQNTKVNWATKVTWSFVKLPLESKCFNAQFLASNCRINN